MNLSEEVWGQFTVLAEWVEEEAATGKVEKSCQRGRIYHRNPSSVREERECGNQRWGEFQEEESQIIS